MESLVSTTIIIRYGRTWNHDLGLLLLREDGLLTNSSALYNGYGLGDDWFEGALLRPDLVLSDVARAINSSNVPQASNSSSRSRLLL